MTTTSDILARARGFLASQARPLELAQFAHFFEGGSAEPVLAELARFQNEDGGFGHGLEPDFRLPQTSVLATTVALQHVRALGAGEESRLVRDAIGFLLATYDSGIQAWPIIPAHDNSAPHAPWWDYDADLAGRWRGFLANPRAEIVGYLWEHGGLVPAGLRDDLTAAALAYLAAPAHELEMHDLLCYVRLAETATLPESRRIQLVAALAPRLKAAVAPDRDGWAAYGLQPLDVAGSPASPFAAAFTGQIEENLDFLAGSQGDDGAWAPAWSWFGAFDADWPQAERDWKGVLTIRALRQLRAFGRL